jgi:hypothetical protein
MGVGLLPRMESLMKTRRDVMIGSAMLAVSAATPSLAAEAPSPLGTSQAALGHYLRALRAQDDGKIDPIKVIDYVRNLGGGGVQLTVPLDSDLKKLRARLEQNRMFLQGDLDPGLRTGTQKLQGIGRRLCACRLFCWPSLRNLQQPSRL